MLEKTFTQVEYMFSFFINSIWPATHTSITFEILMHLRLNLVTFPEMNAVNVPQFGQRS